VRLWPLGLSLSQFRVRARPLYLCFVRVLLPTWPDGPEMARLCVGRHAPSQTTLPACLHLATLPARTDTPACATVVPPHTTP
jgi:hypothetical protein